MRTSLDTKEGTSRPATATLTPDELLSTTRAVRRRLDLRRPLEPSLIEECLELALQAPTGSNLQGWRFVVVTDPERRAAIAEHYQRAFEIYATLPIAASAVPADTPQRAAMQRRIMTSAQYLADHFHEVPAYVIPCITPRTDHEPPVLQCSFYGSVMQAAWSFQLAARARGLGSCWTSLHLMFEEQVADILAIPFAHVQQVALIAVGHVTGGDFHPAVREPLAAKLRWEVWS